MAKETIRLCVWSGPRNISTALMYSFAQRADTTVHDEPLYAHYLVNSAAKSYHPGADEIVAAMENDGARVVNEFILGPHPTPVAYFKQMTHHLVELDLSFMAHTVNVMLTRHPRDMLPSYAKQVSAPTLADVGYKKHVELVEYLRALGQDPPVLDSAATLRNPRAVLKTLCARVGIGFDEAMLTWPAGARKEDGVWAPYWYDSVHRSTGFQPYRPKTDPFPAHLEPLLAECLPYYEELARDAIRV
ncbi:MAG: sulfotransferase family protein [Proteobacteria bacterium]|nr:sulfotransferase family protein [Pseudomonadota bacterium]